MYDPGVSMLTGTIQLFSMKPLNLLLKVLLFFLVCLAPTHADTTEGKRLRILWLGDDGHHKPIGCYRVLKQVFGPKGIDMTFIEDLTKITPERLNQYDVLIVYANHEANPVPPAIRPWVENGGALVALHSAVGCFHPSPEWFSLVGGRFASHEVHTFSPRTIDTDSPITKDLPILTCEDETYVHNQTTNDRHILQVRDPINKGETQPEPYTWTREQGKGRVFYTASGHDMQCWSQPAWQELVFRGILWAAGPRADEWRKLKLPELTLYTPKLEGRAHPDVPMMEIQKPLSAADSARHAQIPAGTRLELFAAEPLVINPIAMNWDAKGRLWVMEAMDYPNDAPKEGKGHDRIVILEDTDGDGKADKRTVFADGLKLGTALTFAHGGVIATDGEEVVFLKDDNGDDVADTRKVLANGLGISDTHACTSHFRYGEDNWIYATVGYSGIAAKLADGSVHKSTQGVFRFKSDLSELEVLQNTTNNTWGLGFTNDGDVMGSTANNNSSWMLSIPARYYERSGMKQPQTPRADTSTVIYPNTRDYTQVDQIDRYTAGAGHEFYNDRLPGFELDDHDVMVCEPTGHIVGLGRIKASGSIFATDFRGNNLYASSDAWSAPVDVRTGPDGAVWIADWYNPIIQHNVVSRFFNPARGYDQPHSPYQTGAPGPGKGNAYVTPLRDREHGRIWRIVPSSGPRKLPVLDSTQPATLLAALSHPSRERRLLAQQLLVERGNPDVEGDLVELTKSPDTITAGHAIWTLEGLGLLKKNGPALDAVRKCLDSAVSRQALLALGGRDPGVAAALPRFLAVAQTPRERLFTLLATADAVATDALATALVKTTTAEAPKADPTLLDAYRLAARHQGVPFLKAVIPQLHPGEPVIATTPLPNSSFEQADGDLPSGGWKAYQWNPGGAPRITTAIVPDGKVGHALKITATEPTDSSVGLLVKLEGNTRYRLSALVKTDLKTQNGQGAMINIHALPFQTKSLSGINDWTPVSFEFVTPDDGRCQINCTIGSFGKATGSAWFDELKLERLQNSGFSLESESLEVALTVASGPAREALESVLATAPAAFTAQVREAIANRPPTVSTEKLPARYEAGQTLYQKVCIECHQMDGRGVPATFPPLAGSEWVKGDRDTMLRIVLGGLAGKVNVAGIPYESVMPGHYPHTDEELAAIVSYVRFQFGGLHEEPVKPSDVAAQRARIEERKFNPWSVGELQGLAK